MSVILAKGSQRFSGQSDDYAPDAVRRVKRAPKEKKKKSHTASRSIDRPLVTIAEPYPRGSLLAPLLNPIHKAIHETTVAVVRAPGDLLYGIKPGEKVDLSKPSPKSKSRALRESDEESDSEEYTDSEEESEDDRDPRASHKKASSDRANLHSLFQERRAERASRFEERRRERERFVQGCFYGNHDAGKEEKHKRTKKHRKEKESVEEIAPGRFRLVLCYWDGQKEVS